MGWLRSLQVLTFHSTHIYLHLLCANTLCNALRTVW